MKYIFIIILVIVAILNLSCDENTKEINDHYTVIDSIKLRIPATWFFSKKINDNFIAMNKKEYRLELYSKSGDLLSYCGCYGKGPGELLKPRFFDYSDNTIFLVDRGNDKILIIKLDAKNQKLNYISEFHTDVNPADICAISRDKVLVSVIGDVNNIKLYNKYGHLLKEYSIPKKESFKNDKDIIGSICFLENLEDDYILIGSIYSLRLYFCYFNHTSNSLTIMKEKDVRLAKSLDMFEIEGKRIKLHGLSPIYCANNKFYVGFHPQNKKIKESFFEVYDKNGNYLRNAYLQNKLVYSITFSNAADTLWFMLPGNDTTVFIAKKIEVKKI